MIKYDVPLGLEHNNNLMRLIQRIKKDSTVLEFGPSTGRLTSFMVSELQCTVYGVEIDEDAFSVCKKYLKKGLCGDIEDYAWQEKFSGVTFDYVIFADVLEHLHDPKRVIQEVKPFLKEDAEILVSIPNIAHNSVLIELLQGRFDYTGTGLLDNTHIHFFTMQTCREMFEESGYHLVYSDGTTAEPYNTEIANSFNNFPVAAEQYLSSRDYGNLYQIIYAFRQKPGEVVDHLSERKNRDYFARVRFDCGEGYDKNNDLILQLDLHKKEHEFIIKENDIPKGCTGIAFTPLDHYAYQCRIYDLMINHEKKNFLPTGNVLYDKDSSFCWAYQGHLEYHGDEIKDIYLKIEVTKIDIFELSQYCFHECARIKDRAQVEIRRSLIEQKLKNAEKEGHYRHLLRVGNFKRPFLNKLYRRMRSFDGNGDKTNVDIMCIDSNHQQIDDKQCVVKQYDGFLPSSKADYVVICFHQVKLKPNYMNVILRYLNQGYANVIFSDCENAQNEPIYKTNFSYDYLVNQTQEYDALVVNASVYNIVAEMFDLSTVHSSYDFVLKLSQITEDFAHIAESLYIKKQEVISYDEGILNSLHENLRMKYKDAFVNVKQVDDQSCRPQFNYASRNVKITIVIPMKDHWQLSDACIQSILDKTDYENYDILILNNRSEESETFAWFDRIKKHDKVQVIDADFEFNWSKLNNFGIHHSDADMFVFLNNDTLVISEAWLNHLCNDAMRPDVGVVGALLLYDDDTIQHAGVVVGMNDFADHIFKQEELSYQNPSFLSPLAKRNVLAVTGACMAISRETLFQIGEFNDTFIICGSDVEICIRAYKQGLRNIYNPDVRLYHLESKSRDTYIPPIDFEMSIKHYAPYREIGDPYFNSNLSRKHTTPKQK